MDGRYRSSEGFCLPSTSWGAVPRMLSTEFSSWHCFQLTGLCFSIHLTQLIGLPLYWVNRDVYDAYMTLTKQSFGILITTMTHWWSPTIIRISGDASVAEQIRKTKDGRVELMFPERLIMIANHQVDTWEQGVHSLAGN